ncbi:hypothetical protein FKM82_025992 [Ascaphus truei]
MSAFYERCRASREARRASGESGTGETPAQEESEGEEPDIVRMAVRFDRREYPPQITPKMFLLEWCRKERLLQPGYQTVRRGARGWGEREVGHGREGGRMRDGVSERR